MRSCGRPPPCGYAGCTAPGMRVYDGRKRFSLSLQFATKKQQRRPARRAMSAEAPSSAPGSNRMRRERLCACV